MPKSPEASAVAVSHSQPIEWRAINTIRTLSMDAVQKASSGHPGAPMALAPLAYLLWQKYLRFDPQDPIWPNRDRFVLSNGHASMLLYSLLFLTGTRAVDPDYEILGTPAVSLDDIKQFRQLGSRTPGHPEYRLVSGVEATTGPLGQGAGNSVGMAIAAEWLAARYNRPDFPLFDYRVWVTVSDGDLMEGVASEAASLAGHLKLSKLCWMYDNNHITLDGPLSLSSSEDTERRFQAYGWRTLHIGDVNDLGMLDRAFDWMIREDGRPSLFIVDTHIGYGAPHRVDTKLAHGEPLGDEEVRLAKRSYGWPEDAQFLVPPEVTDHFRRGIGERGGALRRSWNRLFQDYARLYPDEAAQLEAMFRRDPPAGKDWLEAFPPDPKGIATRDSSAQVLNRIAKDYPWLVGGAADLSTSTKTTLTFAGAGDFTAANRAGRNLHFGVREHAMGAVVNGLALSKLRAFGSTFLIFSDYERPAIRLAALMELPVIQIFTHDSIGLGEDGPTHQPVEQLPSLRAIPGLVVIRPADANEVIEAWRVIVGFKHEPVALILTRQKVPTFDRSRLGAASGLARGAYIFAEAPGGDPEALLIATGSEVSVALEAWEKLQKEGIRVRVVSMPSRELFERQDETYREAVLPERITARVSIEQASTFCWSKYVGPQGLSLGMTTFGASAPIKDLLKKFGFTSDHVVAGVKKLLGKVK